ncbi:Sec23/Sec24 trunk domain-containing protein [Cunninghamella echinulata]|nr:Sec23/Sec24 trunk domain-containing protein [Cunninghamella echinulata]
MTPPTVQQQQPSQIPPELRPPQQPKPRIDPDQMPAPVQVRQQDQSAFENQFFGTLERERVPLATTDYIGLDQGNCNPRYIRSTTDKMPYTKELADISKLPIGLIVQPLAKRRSDEVAVQTVDHGEEGPVRCSRCRAYVSPWCNFVQGGSKFICGICSHSNDVPSWYFANTDMSGRRIDIEQRPELRYGSVDFQVPPDYNSIRKPAPLSYVFAIDVSASSIQSGMVKACCEALKIALYSTTLDHPKLPSSNKIGILTYDKSVHFYNLHPSLSQAQMLVVPDIDDVFIPLQDGFLADTVESKDIIIELLDTLPTMFQERPCPESVFTSAIRGGLQALQQSGGQLFVFQSCLPNFGSDALKSRDDKNIYNTDKEKTLMQPQSDVYKELAKECVKNAVGVNTWFFPAQYCDVSTVGIISELTGGDVRYYPNFNFTTDALVVQHQLDHDVHREIGFDGVLRIRCSDGLQVVDHYGNCNMATYTDMELATVDEDKAIAAVLKHDNKLDISRGATFQCALLYTTKDGHRRVRVHNLNLTVTSEIADVFRHGDIETTVSIILRKAIFDLQHKNRKEIHQKLTEQCVQILTAYRTNCASSTSPGQLILPEAFKLLPVYVHSAIRSKALLGTDMNVDCRSAGTRLFNTLSVRELVWTLYPRLYPLHTMDKECGQHGLNGYIKLPSMMRASYDRLDAGGAYLLDTGSDLYLWLGKNISETFLQNLFNVSSIDQVDPKMTLLPGLDTDLSHQVHSIARKLQSDRARYLQFHVIRQDLDPLEFIFSTWMAEDRNAEVQTYVDYMCVLHRKIQEEMKKNT